MAETASQLTARHYDRFQKLLVSTSVEDMVQKPIVIPQSQEEKVAWNQILLQKQKEEEQTTLKAALQKVITENIHVTCRVGEDGPIYIVRTMK
jgi:hypothetical protein